MTKRRPFLVRFSSNSFLHAEKYSSHGDLDKAKRTMLRAMKLPGATQYSYQIRNEATGEEWVHIGGCFVKTAGPELEGK